VQLHFEEEEDFAMSAYDSVKQDECLLLSECLLVSADLDSP